jgi:hypothetical protein
MLKTHACVLTALAFLNACAETSLIRDAKAAPSAATHSVSCADVYLFDPRVGIGPFNDPVREVSISIDGGRFEAKGKLFRRDWGAFRVCGEAITLRFRSILRGRLEEGPDIRVHDTQPTLSLSGRATIYFEMGGRWREIDETRAMKIKAEIEERPGVRPNTGWEWVDRRDLYYGPHCQQKSERCP